MAFELELTLSRHFSLGPCPAPPAVRAADEDEDVEEIEEPVEEQVVEPLEQVDDFDEDEFDDEFDDDFEEESEEEDEFSTGLAESDLAGDEEDFEDDD